MSDSAVQRRIIWDLVRTHDRDRYLATLFAPEPARDALMALYAFAIDVARIPEAVSEPMLGEIRLQWWRDALQTLEQGGTTGNPAADALGEAIRRFDLPKPLLQGMIDARAFDLSGAPMPDDQALKAYLQKTSGNLFALAARVAGAPGGEADDAAAEAGFAWGLTAMLRLLPLHLSRGRVYLPASRFADEGADLNALLEGKADEKACAALAKLRVEAGAALVGTKEAVNALNRPHFTAFLPLALTPLYLRRLEKQAAGPLQAVADIGPLRRITRLVWVAATGRL